MGIPGGRQAETVGLFGKESGGRDTGFENIGEHSVVMLSLCCYLGLLLVMLLLNCVVFVVVSITWRFEFTGKLWRNSGKVAGIR